MDMAFIVTLIGILVALTNVITEVVKKLTWDKMPTNVLAVAVGELLTLTSGLAYFQVKGIDVVWYYVVALVVIGFMVAYAAMFGFDKLKEIMNWGEKSE